MDKAVEAYQRLKNLKLAAAEVGMPWQALYAHLKKAGVPVVGDKLRYGSDRDRLATLAEAEFWRLVPDAQPMNLIRWQAKYDFDVYGYKVDVKASMPRQLNKRYTAESWAFSFKKQTLICDFICCFCLSHERAIEHVLLVPSEFFAGIQTVSVSCKGGSKWLDYAVPAGDLAAFFADIAESKAA